MELVKVFPAVLLLELLTSVWRELIRRPYSELVASAEIQKRSITLEDKVDKYVRRLFVQLRYPNYSVTQQDASEFLCIRHCEGRS